jgi:hypothetical protein
MLWLYVVVALIALDVGFVLGAVWHSLMQPPPQKRSDSWPELRNSLLSDPKIKSRHRSNFISLEDFPDPDRVLLEEIYRLSHGL